MKTLLALAVISGLAATSTTVHAETWTCLYKGTWITTKTRNTDTMNWLLKWDKVGSKWKVVGDYNDKYGHASFDGECDAKTCNFVQDYKSGKLAGKRYYFTGAYTDKRIDNATTENSFKGTWGYKADARANGGVWDSVATCKKEPAGAQTTPPAPPAQPQPPTPPVQPPKPMQPASGSGNPMVDDILTLRAKTTWTAYDVQMPNELYYVIGSCYDPGTNQKCEATVLTQKGKVVKTIEVMGSGETLDPTQLAAGRAELDKVVAHNQGNKLTEYAMGAKPVSYLKLGFKWTAKKSLLTILDGKKTFKDVNLGKLIPKKASINSVSVFLFGAGSPPAALVQIEHTYSDGQIDGIESEHTFIVVPVPEAMDGD